MFLGIDIGSLSCDAVLIDEAERVRARSVVPTGARNREAIDRAREEVLRQAGVSAQKIRATVSTGYGRARVDGRLAAVTEITCHARGLSFLLPQTRLLIDIGGQDSKAIALGDDGRVVEFAMNDKCAAGTGRFLEAMARALQLDLDDMVHLDVQANEKLDISSTCTVFAESEVVSLIADGRAVANIVAGLNRSIAARSVALIKRVCPEPKDSVVAMSGGVARNAGVVRALQQALGVDIAVPESPDTVGALGAALIAHQRFLALP